MRSPDPDALQRDLQSDIVLQMMVREGVPLTRESYIDLAYTGEPPPWGAELELELPTIFRRG